MMAVELSMSEIAVMVVASLANWRFVE